VFPGIIPRAEQHGGFIWPDASGGDVELIEAWEHVLVDSASVLASGLRCGVAGVLLRRRTWVIRGETEVVIEGGDESGPGGGGLTAGGEDRRANVYLARVQTTGIDSLPAGKRGEVRAGSRRELGRVAGGSSVAGAYEERGFMADMAHYRNERERGWVFDEKARGGWHVPNARQVGPPLQQNMIQRIQRGAPSVVRERSSL